MHMKILVALTVSAGLSFPTEAMAQTATPAPQAARENGAVASSLGTAEVAAMRLLDDAPTAPAAKGRNNRILSENEGYNLGRAAEGRVGVRVGSDMSFRVEKRADTP
ncbi:hypothetical protein EV283_3804 [Sphingomonas sp. BK036]|uniref:hypothetical protein n=1 Tax=Sphingomonas sp. BK036 TaxID=2512122 RepID=UPI00102939AC|nr:hypothetical protein [Sphingomonas sp. BK036]RZT44899.1 hypothetical protein EV283_3804 [Sphingomonas sp. BK036]